MRIDRGTILAPVACLVLCACHSQTATPTGQVAATVEGQEITQKQIEAELAGAQITDPKAMAAARAQALQFIIARKVLAKAAVDQGLDRTPDFAVQKQRETENLLEHALQAKIVGQVPTPTRDEAQQFVVDHPDIFGARKIFTLDQVRFARPTDPKIMAGIAPLNTLAEVEALLKENHVEYKRMNDTLDAMTLNPKVVDQIVKLPPHAIFSAPAGNLVLVNEITDTRVQPMVGDPAIRYATQLILNQRRQDVVQKTFMQLMGKAAKTVKFNKEFQRLGANNGQSGKPAAGAGAGSAASGAPSSGAPSSGASSSGPATKP